MPRSWSPSPELGEALSSSGSLRELRSRTTGLHRGQLGRATLAQVNDFALSAAPTATDWIGAFGRCSAQAAPPAMMRPAGAGSQRLKPF
jgi:hypothetical protein